MRYLRHTTYLWEVICFALYDRCRFPYKNRKVPLLFYRNIVLLQAKKIKAIMFSMKRMDLLGQEYTLLVPKSYRGLLEKSSRKVALGVLSNLLLSIRR